MAYTIVKSDGTILTTIADGTINTTSTSVALPGRNYAGYGQYLDNDWVHMIENFAATIPPANPLRGQLWYNINDNSLRVCPADNTSNAAAWPSLALTSSNGTTTFGSVTVTGNLAANNTSITNGLTTDTATTRLLTVTANANITNVTSTSLSAATGGGTVNGTWTLASGAVWQSTYADLAERFEADTSYDAGTVVEIGGAKEVTAVQYELSEDVFGVISTKAGYIMNAMAGDNNTHPAIAMGGRVPVKVTGVVKKGQRLVSAGNGIARAAKPGEATAFNVIGRSLENKTDDGLGTVEAIVSITK
jgi:hypothetical protein